MKRFSDEEQGTMAAEKKNDDDEIGSTTKSAISRNMKLVFCFFGLQISYVLWGVAQEQIMTQVYKPGKFTSSAVSHIIL